MIIQMICNLLKRKEKDPNWSLINSTLAFEAAMKVTPTKGAAPQSTAGEIQHLGSVKGVR
jgi:hypothetical protein